VASQYIKLPPDSGGGGGAVDSFNGRTGAVMPQSGDYSASMVPNTPAGSIAATDVQAAIDELDAEKQALISVANFKVLGTDGAGQVIEVPGWTQNAIGGVDQAGTFEPNNDAGNFDADATTWYVEPLQASPNDALNIRNVNVLLDNNNSGFAFGTAGTALRIEAVTVSHQQTGDVGEIVFKSVNSSIGNGTDPINVRGMSLSYGFGNFAANVNINGPLQGYGMQFNIDAAATISSLTNITAFYDGNNIGCASPNYTSASFSPTILSINNNTNCVGVNLNPNITTFTGNAGYIGLALSGTFGTFNSNGYYQGVNINPTITSARYAAGLNVSMDNVTPYAGVQSDLVEQDITYTFIAAGDNNAYTLEYTPGATAGAEVVTILGNAIEVQIETGVSTATQVKAAWDASQAATAINAVITGTAGDPQVVFGPTNFANGENPGRILAAWLDGDVDITGSLTFGGALSIGKLSAFASQAIVDGGGTPASIHGLVSNPTVAASATIANGDTLGINTAMLLTIGDNATVTTSLVGVAALALPAVVTMGAGSTIDQLSGATFALSMDGAAGGGTIANLDLCRSIAIPNGITAVTRMSGYKFDLPFGDPGTTTWGFYESPGVNNYFAGNLLIGGTAGSDDTVTNTSVALEIKSTTKAALLSRMTTTQRDALTAVNGMLLYNSTTNKFQGYENGAWVDLV